MKNTASNKKLKQTGKVVLSVSIFLFIVSVALPHIILFLI